MNTSDMNTAEKWFVGSWAFLSLSALGAHKIAAYYAESPCGRGLEMLDNVLTAVVIPLSLLLAIHKNIDIWRRSRRLWWRKCRTFTLWFGIWFAIIPTAVIGFGKGDWTEIPVILCIAAVSLLLAAAAHIRLRHMNCKP